MPGPRFSEEAVEQQVRAFRKAHAASDAQIRFFEADTEVHELRTARAKQRLASRFTAMLTDLYGGGKVLREFMATGRMAVRKLPPLSTKAPAADPQRRSRKYKDKGAKRARYFQNLRERILVPATEQARLERSAVDSTGAARRQTRLYEVFHKRLQEVRAGAASGSQPFPGAALGSQPFPGAAPGRRLGPGKAGQWTNMHLRSAGLNELPMEALEETMRGNPDWPSAGPGPAAQPGGQMPPQNPYYAQVFSVWPPQAQQPPLPQQPVPPWAQQQQQWQPPGWGQQWHWGWPQQQQQWYSYGPASSSSGWWQQ